MKVKLTNLLKNKAKKYLITLEIHAYLTKVTFDWAEGLKADYIIYPQKYCHLV